MTLLPSLSLLGSTPVIPASRTCFTAEGRSPLKRSAFSAFILKCVIMRLNARS